MKTFQLDIVVMLRKENHLSEAKVRTGRSQALCRKARNSLEGPHDEAEVERKALKRRKNVILSKDTCAEKERMGSKKTLRKVRVRLKRRGELNKEMRLETGLIGINQNDGGLIYARLEKKIPVLRSTLQFN